jgi:hypothetical protein
MSYDRDTLVVSVTVFCVRTERESVGIYYWIVTLEDTVYHSSLLSEVIGYDAMLARKSSHMCGSSGKHVSLCLSRTKKLEKWSLIFVSS